MAPAVKCNVAKGPPDFKAVLGIPIPSRPFLMGSYPSIKAILKETIGKHRDLHRDSKTVLPALFFLLKTCKSLNGLQKG